MGIIYILENKINGKHYVGQTVKKFKYRFSSHKEDNLLVDRAIRKYGEENFEKLIVENVPEEELDYWESYYIKACNSLFPNGYNLLDGGSSNKHLLEETKKKISETQKGKRCGELNHFFGKHHTEETKKKISKANKGKTAWLKGSHLTEETKKKISETQKGKRCGELNHFFGKHHTEETKKKISETNKGRKHTKETIKKMSESRKGEKNPNFGKSMSKEQKKKISISQKERYQRKLSRQ
jgi:group I intron endonuclease